MKTIRRICMITMIFIMVMVPVTLASTDKLQFPDAYTQKSGNSKLDNSLNDIVANPSNSNYLTNRYNANDGDYSVKIIIDLGEYKQEYIDTLKANGAEIQISDENLVQALVPVSKLDTIANLPFVDNVREPSVYTTSSVTSEGVNTINASKLQDIGYNGSGVKVGIVDLGFKDYGSKLGTELPSNVVTKSFRDDGIEANIVHGTAVAEVVHDVAPGAQLFLTNFGTDLELNQSINWLISQNVSIISMSAGKPIGPKDGTDYADKIINRAADSGIFWVNSAGNDAESHWSGNFSDPNNDKILNFSDTDQTEDIYTIQGWPIVILLDWNDWPKSDQDYDLVLLDENNKILASSSATQNGTQPPYESILYFAKYTGIYQVEIVKYNATEDTKFHLYIEGAKVRYTVPSGSISIPTTDSSFMVGATSWYDDSLEYYSSQGPTDDGRIKPDITAPSNVTNSIYELFAGTSASAPHVAGAAALLLQKNPGLDRIQLRNAIEYGAKDLGIAGKDNQFGIGRVDVYKSANITSNVTHVVGDINGDLIVTARDALLYLRYAVGQDISPYVIDITDDVTCDNVITAADALKVLRKAVGQNVNLICN